LNHALSIVREYKAELSSPHVLEHLPGSPDLQSATAEVVKQLGESIPPDAREGCCVNSLVRIGKPYQQIIQLALEARADLVSMGARGRGALDVALFGSTTYRVIQLLTEIRCADRDQGGRNEAC
jgi:nucleotide-binding universal stress UspA family protein